MQSDQRNQVQIDGKSYELDAELERRNAIQSALRIVENSATDHPWVIGVVAITAVTWLSKSGADPWVCITAIVSIFSVTAISARHRRKREHKE